jgi:hypothetical protein
MSYLAPPAPPAQAVRAPTVMRATNGTKRNFFIFVFLPPYSSLKNKNELPVIGSLYF